MSANVILVDTNREVIKKGTNLRFWPALAVALILLVALWLRVPGMNWGLPEGEHFYASYQPDEYTLFYWIRQMKPGVYDFNPHSYFNGTLILFLLAGFYKILSFLGLLKVASSPLFYYQHAEEWMKFYWYGRILMVGIGMLTVWVIYKAGRIAFGRITGLLAAFLFAVVPMHAVISPQLLIEPAATLWFAALILFCFKILKKSEMKNYIWAGVALGSACAVKINCLPLALLLFAAHGMGRVKKWDFKLVREAVRDKRLWISLGASVTAYLIFNPYLLFNLREALFEFKDYYNRYRFGWSYLGYSPIFSFTGLFGYGAGPWFLGWGFFSVLFSFFSKKREIWLTLLGFLLFFYLNSRSSTMFLKYHVVTLPFLVILMAYSFTAVFKKIPRKAGVLFSFLFVWVNLQTLSLSLAYGRLFERPDARDVSSAWIKEYIPEGSKIAVFRKPFWYSPPVIYNQYFFTGRSEWWHVKPVYEMINLQYDLENIRESRPDYVVLSQWENRIFRRNKQDYAQHDRWDSLEKVLSDLGYRKMQAFENHLETGNRILPRGFPPDDWQQILAEVRIYQRV